MQMLKQHNVTSWEKNAGEPHPQIVKYTDLTSWEWVSMINFLHLELSFPVSVILANFLSCFAVSNLLPPLYITTLNWLLSYFLCLLSFFKRFSPGALRLVVSPVSPIAEKHEDPALCVYQSRQDRLSMEFSVLIGWSGKGYQNSCFPFYSGVERLEITDQTQCLLMEYRVI